MKTLHVINDLKLGGTQNLAWRTWNGLSDRGSDVSLCVLRNSEREHSWDTLPEKVSRLDVHGDYRRFGAMRSWSKQLAAIASENKPDLIHSWLWTADVVAASAAARLKIPHVVHVVDRRNWQASSLLKHRYRKWITKRHFDRAGSHFLAVSQAAADFAVTHLQIDAHKISVAYNSINTLPFLSIPDSPVWLDTGLPVRIGIAARIEAEKGHIYLLQAVKLLRARDVNISVKITGDGSERARLEQFVAENGLADCVEFVGWVDNVTDFLKGIDIFAVPSIDSEGLPTTILEAMAAGRLVIATDTGGASEAITPQTGRIVPPRDADALADAIQEAYNNRTKVAEMVGEGRKRVQEKFSMPAMLSTIQAKYRSLVA